MGLDFGERLRIAGQWLDAQASQSADITVVEHDLSIKGIDPRGEKLQIAFTELQLERLSEFCVEQRTNPFGEAMSHWAPCLRTLGGLIQGQMLQAHRIWTADDRIWVSGLRNNRFVSQSFLLDELTQRDRAHARLRQVRDLRERTAPRRHWWDRLREVSA